MKPVRKVLIFISEQRGGFRGGRGRGWGGRGNRSRGRIYWV